MEGIGVSGVGDSAGGEGFSIPEVHREIDLLGYKIRSPALTAGQPRYMPTPTHEGGGDASGEQVVWDDGEEGQDSGMPRVPPGMSELSLGSRAHLTSDEYRLRYQKHVHHMPRQPSPWDMACYAPKAMSMFFVRLCDAFGFKFIALVVAVYGLSQGFGELYMSMSIDFFLKDDLALQPADAQVFKSVSHLPWNVKPIYGLISDTLPILGYQRGPYIVIAGAIGMVAYLTLCLDQRMTFNVAALLVTLANYSIASPDVIIDAAVTERSQRAPMYASDLQSLSWGAHAVGGILGCLSVGKAQMKLKARGIFGLTAITSFIIFILAVLRWLPEDRLPASERRVHCDFHGQRRLYALATFVAVSAVFLAVGVANIENKDTAGIVTMAVAVVVATAVYLVLSRISPKIAKPAVFFFLREAFAPSIGQIMFYWYTSAPGGPEFKADFLGNLSCLASVSMICGIILYNKYMSAWKYRTIFTAAQLLSFATGMLDYIIVARLNLRAGISDKAFVLGDEAITPMLRKVAAMPFFVLCSKVCPEKCEATLFALLMALSNFGGDLGSYLGVWMVKFFGVTRTDYSRLPQLVIVKTFLRLLPIIFVPFLLPDASPADEILTKAEKELSADGTPSSDDDGDGDREMRVMPKDPTQAGQYRSRGGSGDRAEAGVRSLTTEGAMLWSPSSGGHSSSGELHHRSSPSKRSAAANHSNAS